MKKMIRLLASLILLCVICAEAGAQNAEQFKLPVTPGPNYAGTHFCFAVPAMWAPPGGPAVYIRLYIAAAVRTEVELRVGGVLKKTLIAHPEQTSGYDLLPLEAQTLVRDDTPPVPNDQIRAGKAVTLTSAHPIIVYVVSRNSYTGEGMLVLPVNALGREYRVGSYTGVSSIVQELPSQYLIAAPYDGTVVEICHPSRTPNHEKGESFTITMNAGDVFSAMSMGVGGDMSGATIRSSKPVAVTSGVSCAYVPAQVEFCCCDQLMEMMMPAESWGTHYKAVPISTRLKGDFYRVVAREPNTAVFINGKPYATLSSGGCGGEGESWLEYRAVGKNVVDISSDKPVSVYQYNTAGSYDSVPSDPFYMALMPVQQYRNEAYISTPSADFPQNFLNIVFDAESVPEISLLGTNEWKPVTSLYRAGTVENFQEDVNGRSYRGFSTEINPGVYRIRSARSFTANIYGFASYTNYGYPAVADARNLAITSTTPPAVDLPDALCVLPVAGSAASRAVHEGSEVPLALVGIAAAENFLLQDLVYQPGISVRSGFNLVPADPARPGFAVVFASDVAGNVTYDSIRYEPGLLPQVVVSRDAVYFGEVELGTSSEHEVEVRNDGTIPVDLNIQGMLGGAAGFSVVDPPSSPVRLLPGERLVLKIRFMPSERGNLNDTLVLFFQGCGNSHRIPLWGNGRRGQLAVPGAAPAPEVTSVAVEPNPARGDGAAVTFRMSGRGTVRIAIVDALGRELRVIEPGAAVDAGTVRMPLDLSGVPSGAYFVRIIAGEQISTAPLVVGR